LNIDVISWTKSADILEEQLSSETKMTDGALLHIKSGKK
jgi:hypothetical protein